MNLISSFCRQIIDNFFPVRKALNADLELAHTLEKLEVMQQEAHAIQSKNEELIRDIMSMSYARDFARTCETLVRKELHKSRQQSKENGDAAKALAKELSDVRDQYKSEVDDENAASGRGPELVRDPPLILKAEFHRYFTK